MLLTLLHTMNNAELLWRAWLLSFLICSHFGQTFAGYLTEVESEIASIKCDCQRLENNRRIIGGNEADIHEYPFQVHLNSQFETKMGSFKAACGGTLISSQWILTAGHCVAPPEFPGTTPLIEVRVGEHTKSSAAESSQTEIFYTKDFIVHEKYKTEPITVHDVALVRLNSPVNFTEAVSPACLPLKRRIRKKVFKGELMVAVGWGRISTDYKSIKTSDALKEIDLRVYSRQECVLPKFRWSLKSVTKNMICGYKRGQSVCSGDSGGPLIYINNGHNYVVGVASRVGGPKCVYKKVPAIFMRVASYVKWIQEKTQEQFCSA